MVDPEPKASEEEQENTCRTERDGNMRCVKTVVAVSARQLPNQQSMRAFHGVTPLYDRMTGKPAAYCA